jgi:TRAP-type uncharacterized transport system substrate-binding protein
MRKTELLMSFIAAAGLAAPAVAQVVGLGTTQAGATAQLSTVVAKVVSERGGVQMRPQPMAGVAQYAPLVNAGEIDFGVANVVEARYLVQGREIVEKPNPELRLVARLVPCYLANAGLKITDTKQVLVPAFPRMFEMFKQGQLATAISTIGSPVLKEWEAAVGPVRFLGFDDSPQAVAALQQFIPGAYVVELAPGPGVVGLPAPTKILVYDYVIFAGAKVADDVVAKVAAALHDHPADMKAASPLFKEFDPQLMAKDLGIAYHPGAIRYFQLQGIWPGRK